MNGSSVSMFLAMQLLSTGLVMIGAALILVVVGAPRTTLWHVVAGAGVVCVVWGACAAAVMVMR
jgi:hypothetical protein